MHMKTPGEKIFDALNCCFMIIISLFFLYPFIYEINLSLSTPAEASQLSLRLLPPDDATIQAYIDVLASPAFLTSVWNSVVRTVIGTILTVLFTFCGAYVLAKREMPLNRFFSLLILFTFFFSGGLIPSYMLIKELNLMGSVWALILPTLTSAWFLMITRNFIAAVPQSLEEAARIDGANILQIMFRVIFPGCKPIIAVISLWSFVSHWNSWYDAMLYTPGREQTTLALLLHRILVMNSSEDLATMATAVTTTPETSKAAIAVIAILPIILVYPLFQKYIIKGVNVGAVKG